jgi:hypothetical protein
MHIDSRRHDPFRAKCRDMERSILAAKRSGKMKARVGKRAANSSERVRMQAILRTAVKNADNASCDEAPCACTLCVGAHEFVVPTTWRFQERRSFQKPRLYTFVMSVQRDRRAADHVKPLLRWFVMNMRGKDAAAVNRFAALAFSKSLSGRHARLHAIMYFGFWNQDSDRPKRFIGWDELTEPDPWGDNFWGKRYSLNSNTPAQLDVLDS